MRDESRARACNYKNLTVRRSVAGFRPAGVADRAVSGDCSGVLSA